MRPGLYVWHGQVLHHVSAPPPWHVLGTKGPNPGAGAIARLGRRLLARTLSVPVPPWLGDRSGATCLIRTYNGTLLLLAPEAGWVRREAAFAKFDDAYVRMRNLMGKHIPMPRFSVSENGRILTEAFVHGRRLRDLETKARQRAAHDLLRSQLDIVQHEAVDGSFLRLSITLDLLKDMSLPPELARVLRGETFRELFVPGPLTPCNLDLHEVNTIATEAGVVVIDWPPESLSWYPFWWSTFRLCGSVMPEEFVRGVFDRHLDELWASTGRQPVAWSRVRRELLAALVLVRMEFLLKPSYPSMDTRSSGESIAVRLTQYWQKWSTYLRTESDTHDLPSS